MAVRTTSVVKCDFDSCEYVEISRLGVNVGSGRRAVGWRGSRAGRGKASVRAETFDQRWLEEKYAANSPDAVVECLRALYGAQNARPVPVHVFRKS